MTVFDLSARFFLQLAFILAVCRVVGWAGRKLGQPQVVGEMIAGVVMGPSLFGLLAPGAQAALFPPDSKAILFVVSQLGLGLYMFLIGVEFRLDLLRSRLRSAVGVSAAGMLAPFVLGGMLAWAFFERPELGLFTAQSNRTQAVLFLGAALCITAFPMLARIIFERGLTNTRMGALALAAGSMDDACAWGLLAVALAFFPGPAASGILGSMLDAAGWKVNIAVLAVGGGALYVGFMATVGHRLLRGFARAAERRGGIDNTLLASVLILLMLACWFTDAISLYAVFGAFVLGAAMPRGAFAEELIRKLEPVTTNLLLPLFFIYSGLNTRLALVNSPALWAVTGLVFAAAVFGKGGACYAAARLSGETHREAAGIGTLMNARGLMELIIVNIGLQRGLITETLFTMLVIMAVVTTVMAGPVFEWLYARPARREVLAAAVEVEEEEPAAAQTA